MLWLRQKPRSSQCNLRVDPKQYFCSRFGSPNWVTFREGGNKTRGYLGHELRTSKSGISDISGWATLDSRGINNKKHDAAALDDPGLPAVTSEIFTGVGANNGATCNVHIYVFKQITSKNP